MSRCPQISALAVATLIASTTHAQEGWQVSATAEALFQEGKELAAKGSFPEACAKFEASVRIERAVGALLNLADCHERVGRTASAWSEYSDAASDAERAGDQVRARFARKRAAELQPSLSRIALTVDSASPGLTVQFNGTQIARDAWGSAIPVDPGRLLVRATGTGFRDWTTTIYVSARETVAVHIPALHALPARKAIATRQRLSPDRTGFYIAAGAGAAALGFGAAFGIKTLATQANVDERCGDRYCDATGLEWEREARTYAALSTIGLGTGVALGGLAAWLYFAKPSPGAGLAVSVAPSGLGVHGAF